jgi:HAD superfamily hydrolase (TIGR01509 family)
MNVVFDLGGVVLTWDPAAIIASVFDDEREQSLVRERVFGDPDWARLDRGEISDDEVISRSQARTGIPHARLRVLFDTFPRALVPVEPVLELVSQVRAGGNHLYVLSNLHHASFERVRDELGVFELFDGSVVSCEVGAAKPEPAIYRRLLGDFALDPAATVFFDDTQANVDAAAQFGIETILFTDAASCRSRLRALAVHLTSASSRRLPAPGASRVC